MKYVYYILLTSLLLLLMGITIKQIHFVNELKEEKNESKHLTFIFRSLFPYAPDSSVIINTRLTDEFLDDFYLLLETNSSCQASCIQNFWEDSTFNKSLLSDYYFYEFSPQIIAAFQNNFELLKTEREAKNERYIYKVSMKIGDQLVQLSFVVKEVNHQILLLKYDGINQMVDLLCP